MFRLQHSTTACYPGKSSPPPSTRAVRPAGVRRRSAKVMALTLAGALLQLSTRLRHNGRRYSGVTVLVSTTAGVECYMILDSDAPTSVQYFVRMEGPHA